MYDLGKQEGEHKRCLHSQKGDGKGLKRDPPSFVRVKGKEGRNIFSPPRFCLCSLTIKLELLLLDVLLVLPHRSNSRHQ